MPGYELAIVSWSVEWLYLTVPHDFDLEGVRIACPVGEWKEEDYSKRFRQQWPKAPRLWTYKWTEERSWSPSEFVAMGILSYLTSTGWELVALTEKANGYTTVWLKRPIAE